ncbi:N-acetyl-alpha-D-glucosaminyl L-malate synthase BshA [Sulfoacidibacillus thermotolerans]|uniref:N-acetyl-alpha-D-glucosaminyl L-malate synthase BshA n=1 Tax=Sulfoacidibacillus thermotolerans TaxID=1765684 RepID=A0A2U3D704_SULT2|nr:N-acetyl-alpha-D-glucosaminyl L-malate synthase BshA [Sulfoacidibacillus thermotolerans]PWI57070.1 N-acetyl-alpha-D-glucosaminyl L-malate synthase BshA [Sulfoacidibacillus thermotolerans]
MKIGISCYATLGGSGAVATELGKALAMRGHEVHFIVSGTPFRLGYLGYFMENIYIHEVETTSYPVLQSSPYDLALSAKMADVIRHFDLDILHAHYAIPYAVCAFLAREMLHSHKVRIVTTLHGTDITVLAQDPLLRDVIRLGIEKSDAVTAVSQSLIDQTNELFEPACPIIKIHNFVNLHQYRRLESPKLKRRIAPNGEKILLHMSNFRAVKRIPDVIEIFRQVRRELPAKLLMVGEGPELDAARKLTCKEGIADDVLFLGKQDEVAPLLSLADLLLLPSQKESFGLVALEAMACGVPVIGSTAGGIPEVVEHGVSGYLASVGDTEKMGEYALSLLQHPENWKIFSSAARKRAAHFTMEEKVSQYESLYQRLVLQPQECES